MNLGPSAEGERFAESADAAATIAALTTRDDFLITDNPELAFLAQRLVPPELADPSATRVRARELTGDDLVRAGTDYKVRLVALSGDRLRGLRTFRSWLDDAFVPVKVYSRGGNSPRVVYLRRGANFDQARLALDGFVSTASGADFGGILRLRGYSVDRAELVRNGNVGVTYAWEGLGRASVDYHIMTELRGPDDQVWSAEELSLGGRNVGLVDWQPGVWLFQTTILDAPDKAPADDYSLVVGVYDSRARSDLPITAGDPRLGSRGEPLQRFELARVVVR
jgi:hypothetical protein